MEVDPPSPPTAVNTEESCPVLDGPSPPSLKPSQIPSPPVPHDLTLGLPQPTPTPASLETTTEPLRLSPESPIPSQASPPCLSPPAHLIPASSPSTPPTSSTSGVMNASPDSPISPASSSTHKAPDGPPPTHPSPPVCSPLSSPTSTPTSSPAATSPILNPPTTSTPASSTSSTSTVSSPPTTTSSSASPTTAPKKRTFAGLAKRVIVQERLRKADEEDAKADDEDEEPEEDLTFDQLEEKAKGGDARAQTRLGQHYLLLAEEKDADQNNLLAVKWLIEAAKQGRGQGARLLQRCWVQGKGITPENEGDVRKLSTESKFEQAVRKAARMMYWKLNPDRKKMMSVSEMLGNVSHVNSVQAGSRIPPPTSGQTQKVLESMVSSESSQMVDLEDFVEITKKYAQGIVPGQSSSQDSPPPKKAEPRHTEETQRTELPGARKAQKSSWGLGRSGMRSGAMKRAMDIKSHFMVLQYPLHVIIGLKEHLVDWASRAGVQWLSTAIPTHHVNALIFFFIISNLTVDLFAFVIPLLVFYLSFISMIICTLRVFQSSKAWENFSALTALLTRFEPGLDVEQAETNFGWNNLEPYLYFILSVFFVIFSFPVSDKGWIPCSELSTVAIFFTAVSYMSLSPTATTYARKALFIEVASSLCSLTKFLPDKMAVPRLLGQTFATLPLGESVVLKLSLPCLLYVYLFYLFFSMARMRGFRGTYCFLVPYLVCFMWCEFSVVLLQNSTPVGLIRTCVAYFLFLFALPVLAFGLAAMLFFQVVKWFLELELTKVIVTLAVCAVPVTLRLWTRFSLSILDVFRSVTHRGAVKVILFCVSMVIMFFCMYVYHSEGQNVYNSTMSWRRYGELCGPPAWQRKGMAKTQIFCSHLDGHRITWTGRFKHVRVAETENGAQSVINMLPVFMGDWLRCLYGQNYPKCEQQNAAVANITDNIVSNSTLPPLDESLLLRMQEEEELCQLKAMSKHVCHVKRFDSYRFDVTVGMIQDGGVGAEDPARDIVLIASHEFRHVLLNLDPGNLVEFRTVLEGRLGGKAPNFELEAIHCLDCDSSLLTGGRQVKIGRNWRSTTLHAIKFAFDFFFSPFLSAEINV